MGNVQYIEWAARRVLSGQRSVYWVGRSDSNSRATFFPQSAPDHKEALLFWKRFSSVGFAWRNYPTTFDVFIVQFVSLHRKSIEFPVEETQDLYTWRYR